MTSHPIRSAAEAAQIAEANMGLLHAAVAKHRGLWPNDDYEEALSLASAAFWRSCLAFNPDHGTLGTLVYAAVRNALLQAVRNAIIANRRGDGRPVEQHPGNTPTAAPADPFRHESPWWMRLLTEEDRLVVTLLARGFTQDDVGRVIGRSHTTVYNLLGEIRDVLTEAGVTPGFVADRPTHRRNPRPRRSATAGSRLPHIDQTNARGDARGARQRARPTPAGDSAKADESSYFVRVAPGPAQNPAFSAGPAKSS